MRILITGHLGYIGRHLYDRLKNKGHHIYGYDKKDSCSILPKDVSLIFHLAAQTSVLDSMSNLYEDAESNILLSIKLLQRYPDSKIIYTASDGASRQNGILSPYGLSKEVAAAYFNKFHKNTVICGLSNIFGRGDHGIVDLILNNASGKMPLYGDGSTRDFVFIDDLVDGLIKAINWSPGHYSMGFGKSISIRKLLEISGIDIIERGHRRGEIVKMVVYNTTPDWTPTVNVVDYIKKELCYAV